MEFKTIVGTRYFGLEDSQMMSICVELKMYRPNTSDISLMQHRKDFNIIRFLVGLKPNDDFVRSQILGNPQVPSFLNVFSS